MGLRAPRTFATIDIGSNGVRLFVARPLRQKLEVLADLREPLRLGQDSFRHGVISERTIHRLVQCFLKYRQISLSLGAFHLRAAATSALRDAKNGAQVIQEVWRQTGISIELIGGVQEAHLLHLAIGRSLDLRSNKALLLDLGGGSLEAVVAQGPRIHHAQSLKLGTVRLLERCGADAKYVEYAQVVRRELERLVTACDAINDLIQPQTLVATGGCLRALTRLSARINRRPLRSRLNIDEVEDLSAILFALSLNQRCTRLNLKRNRADVIRPAVVIVLEIMRHFNFPIVQVPNVGIKNGLLWEMVDQVLFSPAAGRAHPGSGPVKQIFS